MTAVAKIKNKGGRPVGTGLKVPLAKFKEVVYAYLAECADKRLTPLVIELAVRLGVNDDTISEYRKKPGYDAVIKEFDKLSEIGWIRYAEATNKPVFPIFMLKAKYGYIEQQKLDITSGGETLGVVALPPRSA